MQHPPRQPGGSEPGHSCAGAAEGKDGSWKPAPGHRNSPREGLLVVIRTSVKKGTGCALTSVSPSPRPATRRAGLAAPPGSQPSASAASTCVCVQSTSSWTARHPRSGEGCWRLLGEDDGWKRRAAQGQAKSFPGGSTQANDFVLVGLELGRLQLGTRLCTQSDGDGCSIPMLETGQAKAQITLMPFLGCQHIMSELPTPPAPLGTPTFTKRSR